MKDMKKELYVKPEIVVVELESEGGFLVGSLPTNGAGIAGSDNAGDSSADTDAQGRRGGGWGSLWD